jgi:hypothetical protein
MSSTRGLYGHPAAKSRATACLMPVIGGP